MSLPKLKAWWSDFVPLDDEPLVLLPKALNNEAVALILLVLEDPICAAFCSNAVADIIGPDEKVVLLLSSTCTP